jgi:hypothetical protein
MQMAKMRGAGQISENMQNAKQIKIDKKKLKCGVTGVFNQLYDETKRTVFERKVCMLRYRSLGVACGDTWS